MAAFAVRPVLVVLLLLTFCCQTLATAVMHCKSEQAVTEAGTQVMAMSMHDHSMHHQEGHTDTGFDNKKADCCSTKGQCHLACSLALSSVNLPLAINLSAPVADNYLGLAPADVLSSVYKPPISV